LNVYVHVINGDFEHEIWELTRVFFPDRPVKVLYHLPVQGANEGEKAGEKSDQLGDLLIVGQYSCSDCEIIAKSCLKDDSGKVLFESRRSQKLDESIVKSYLKRKREIKKVLCQCVYDVLSRLTGKHPYWGILTGVRPLKVVHHLMDDGLSDGEVLGVLKSEYYVRDDKALLLVDTARNQRDIVKSATADTVSLYIHIPFCTTRCLYCSFPSVVMDGCRGMVDAYIDSLVMELQRVVSVLLQKGVTVQSLYIGGGTPTALAYSQLERLLSAVDLLLDGRSISEYTVECGRPDTLDIDKLTLLKAFGVNRISINPQTMNQETLDEIGRRHTVEQVVSRFHMARYVGFDCINMDIIVGLPGEGIQHMEKTMEAIAALQPDNLTVHTLAVKRASRLKESLDRYPLTSDDTAERMLDVCQRWVERMGLIPYYLYRQKYMVGNLENVGYTKPGKACIYNIQMMGENQTIWAFGAGAVSKVYFAESDCIQRVPNVKDVKEYMDRLDEMIGRKMRFIDHREGGIEDDL